MRLNRSEIATRIPHAGNMVLLDTVDTWDDDHIVCRAVSHRDHANPLYVSGQLSSVCAVEYAAQAMAVHGSLLGDRRMPDRVPGGAISPTGKPRVGFLASVRNVRMDVARLDDIFGVLTIEARRESGDDTRVLYGFEVRSGTRVLVSGRAAVVLDADDGLLS